MFRLKLENVNQNTIELTNDESRYQVLKVEGLNPPNANIRRTEFAGADGSRYMLAKLEERNIVITVRLNGDIERNRSRLYEFARTKQWCKIYYANGLRDVYAEGWVENTECDLFTIGETMQISIVCPDPYFYDLSEIVTDISRILGNFKFPFSFGAKGVVSPTTTDNAIEFSVYEDDKLTNVINYGSNETGMSIKITVADTVSNPIVYNFVSGEFLKIKYTFAKGDEININTTSGKKSITLTKNGVTTNLINKLDKNSTWLKLKNGDNLFIYDADSGVANMFVLFSYRPRYEAV